MSELAEEYYCASGLKKNLEQVINRRKTSKSASDNSPYGINKLSSDSSYNDAEKLFQSSVIAGIEKIFSQEELKLLNEFHNSPIGKTYIRKAPELGELIHASIISATKNLN